MEDAELSDDVYEAISDMSEQGNQFAEDGNHAAAADVWQLALTLLPEPAHSWEAWIWLQASIADVRYQMQDYAATLAALDQALRHEDAAGSPFVHYLQGKARHRLGDAGAVESLARAHAIDGDDIFTSDGEEGAEMLQLLRPTPTLH